MVFQIEQVPLCTLSKTFYPAILVLPILKEVQVKIFKNRKENMQGNQQGTVEVRVAESKRES